jgi:anti-anti-sigma factor
MRTAPTRPRLRPGILDLSIRRRGAVVELGLAGDLDMATAPQLGEAMARLRIGRGPAQTIVIETSAVDFVAAAGYRALQAALTGPDGRRDPHVCCIVGPAVARIEAAIVASAST